jgi:peroxiredoxin family protein
MSQEIRGLHELFLGVKTIQYIHKNSTDKNRENVIPMDQLIAKGKRSLYKNEDTKLYM